MTPYYGFKRLVYKCQLFDIEQYRIVVGVASMSSWDDFTSEFSLTPREKEILRLIFKGSTSNQIASDLYISIHTVKTHRKTIYRKLGVNNLVELIQTIMGNNL